MTLEPKKSKAWIVLTVIGFAFLVIGFLATVTPFLIVALIIFVVAVVCAVLGSKKYKERLANVQELDNAGLLDSIKMSISNGTVKTFNKGAILANEDSVFENDKNRVSLVKFDNVANCYSSNIIDEKYDYDHKQVNLECKDGYVRYMYIANRNNNPDYDSFVSYVKSHIVRDEEV